MTAAAKLSLKLTSEMGQVQCTELQLSYCITNWSILKTSNFDARVLKNWLNLERHILLHGTIMEKEFYGREAARNQSPCSIPINAIFRK